MQKQGDRPNYMSNGYLTGLTGKYLSDLGAEIATWGTSFSDERKHSRYVSSDGHSNYQAIGILWRSELLGPNLRLFCLSRSAGFCH